MTFPRLPWTTRRPQADSLNHDDASEESWEHSRTGISFEQPQEIEAALPPEESFLEPPSPLVGHGLTTSRAVLSDDPTEKSSEEEEDISFMQFFPSNVLWTPTKQDEIETVAITPDNSPTNDALTKKTLFPSHATRLKKWWKLGLLLLLALVFLIVIPVTVATQSKKKKSSSSLRAPDSSATLDDSKDEKESNSNPPFGNNNGGNPEEPSTKLPEETPVPTSLPPSTPAATSTTPPEPTPAPTRPPLFDLISTWEVSLENDLFADQAYMWLLDESTVSTTQQRFILTWLDIALEANVKTRSHECDWAGITCNGNQELQKLDWTSTTAAQHTLPVQIIWLQGLEFLRLEGFGIVGTLPDLSSLLQLQYLDLAHNNLVEFPSLPPSLQHLHAPVNQLQAFPTAILPNLRYLRVQRNSLTGSMESWQLPQIYYLDVGNNALTGSLPAWPTVRHFFANDNELEGTIPLGLNLLQADWSHNDLQGELPATDDWVSLRVFGNDQLGEISNELCRLGRDGFLVELGADCSICTCRRTFCQDC